MYLDEGVVKDIKYLLMYNFVQSSFVVVLYPGFMSVGSHMSP